MIRLCVVSEETDTLREWLDAVDPLRFHFSVGSVASSLNEAVTVARNTAIQAWVCRFSQAVALKGALESAGIVSPQFVVICSNPEQASQASDRGFRRLVLDGESLWIFAAAVQSARLGQSFLSPGIIDIYHDGISELIGATENELVESLTAREIEVILLLKEGLTNDEISDKIYTSRATVSTHLLSVYRKLDFSNRTEVAIFAVRNAAALRLALEDSVGSAL